VLGCGTCGVVVLWCCGVCMIADDAEAGLSRVVV
jgi:hypothetical protein